MFPADDILMARGQYATLSSERRQQVERYQKAAQTVMSLVAVSLKDAQDMPPEKDVFPEIEKCLVSMKDARIKIVAFCTDMIPLKEVAWPKT